MPPEEGEHTKTYTLRSKGRNTHAHTLKPPSSPTHQSHWCRRGAEAASEIVQAGDNTVTARAGSYTPSHSVSLLSLPLFLSISPSLSLKITRTPRTPRRANAPSVCLA